MLVTMDGEQGVEMLRLVQPETASPVHYDDYRVFKSPLAEVLTAVGRDNPRSGSCPCSAATRCPWPVPATYPAEGTVR